MASRWTCTACARRPESRPNWTRSRSSAGPLLSRLSTAERTTKPVLHAAAGRRTPGLPPHRLDHRGHAGPGKVTKRGNRGTRLRRFPHRPRSGFQVASAPFSTSFRRLATISVSPGSIIHTPTSSPRRGAHRSTACPRAALLDIWPVRPAAAWIALDSRAARGWPLPAR